MSEAFEPAELYFFLILWPGIHLFTFHLLSLTNKSINRVSWFLLLCYSYHSINTLICGQVRMEGVDRKETNIARRMIFLLLFVVSGGVSFLSVSCLATSNPVSFDPQSFLLVSCCNGSKWHCISGGVKVTCLLSDLSWMSHFLFIFCWRHPGRSGMLPSLETDSYISQPNHWFSICF